MTYIKICRGFCYLLAVFSLSNLLACSKGLETDSGNPASVIDLARIQAYDARTFEPTQCGELDLEGRLIIAAGKCGNVFYEVPVLESVKLIKTPKIWLRAVVKSSRYRTGIHFNDGILERFSYHSGDGKSQLLLREIELAEPINSAVLRIIPSETGETDGDVVIGPIIISAPQQNIDGPAGGYPYQKGWARDNNPDKAFWFDRYVSQIRDFAVSLPNVNSRIWESYFALGVNDRFSTGDYFCMPDDSLIVRDDSTMQVYAIYLGALQWNREVREEDDRLIVNYTYDGPIVPHDRIDEGAGRSFLSNGYGGWPYLPDMWLHLIKTYIFKTDLNYAAVHLGGTATSHNGSRYEYKWLVQDTAVFDFKEPDPFRVESWFLGERNRGGIVTVRQPLEGAWGAGIKNYLFREQDAKPNLASAYFSHDADIIFTIPSDYDYRPYVFSDTQLNIGIEQKPSGAYWSHGVQFGFSNSGTIDASYYMLFLSGFRDPDELDSLASWVLRNG